MSVYVEKDNARVQYQCTGCSLKVLFLLSVFLMLIKQQKTRKSLIALNRMAFVTLIMIHLYLLFTVALLLYLKTTDTMKKTFCVSLLYCIYLCCCW